MLTCTWCNRPAIGRAYQYEDHTYPEPSCGWHGYHFETITTTNEGSN